MFQSSSTSETSSQWCSFRCNHSTFHRGGRCLGPTPRHMRSYVERIKTSPLGNPQIVVGSNASQVLFGASIHAPPILGASSHTGSLNKTCPPNWGMLFNKEQDFAKFWTIVQTILHSLNTKMLSKNNLKIKNIHMTIQIDCNATCSRVIWCFL
jgi:hypothetical protein